MSKQKKYSAGERKNGTQWFKIDNKFVSKKKFLRSSRASVGAITRKEFKPREPEVGKKLSKIVVFMERIRNTRVARTVRRAYTIETSDFDIQQQLADQYDRGGNYVLGVVSTGIGELKPGQEQEIDRGAHGSADKGYMRLVA